MHRELTERYSHLPSACLLPIMPPSFYTVVFLRYFTVLTEGVIAENLEGHDCCN